MTKRNSKVFCLVLVSILAACHAGTEPTQYYVYDANSAIYIAWTEDATGHIQGQVQGVSIDPNDPTKLRTTNASFTGTRNGSGISIVFAILSAYSGATWTGTLGWQSLSLVIPTAGLPDRLTLHSGSFDDFQTAAQHLQGVVASAQQQKATQQQAAAIQARIAQEKQATYESAQDAATRVSSAYSQVNAAFTYLAQTITATPAPGALSRQYASEWTTMLGTWAKEQQAAAVSPMTCYQKSQVQYVASEVDYNLSRFVYLDSETQSAIGRVQPYFANIRDGVAELQQWAPVYYQRSLAYYQLLGQPSPVRDPSAAVQTYSQRVADSVRVYTQRLAVFEAIVLGYDNQAKTLDRRAKAFADAIECSG